MWIPVTEEALANGLAVNAFGKHDDSPYSVSTVISVRDGNVRLARPMAYANADFDSLQPSVHCEVYEMSVARFLEQALMWKDSDNGKPRRFATKAAA